MGRQGKGRIPQQPIKGFRPGKEPPRVRTQQAKQQLGKVSPAQERLMEMFAQRTPAESRAMIRRWGITLLAVAVALAILGAVLYVWSVVAGVVVHVLAGVVLAVWWRVRRQRADLEALAEAVGGGGKGKPRRR